MDRLQFCPIVGRMDALSAMPESFAAGTTVKLRRTHELYPASDGWGLILYVTGAQVVNAVAVAAGDSFDITLSAAATGALSPGTYAWTERVIKAGEVADAASGFVTVTRNLAAAGPGDAQSFAEKTLPLVRAAIEAIVTGRMASYQVPGRGAEYLNLDELRKLEGELVADIRRARSGGRIGRQHLIDFRRAGPA